MRTAAEPWEAFRATLVEFMAVRGLTAPQLARLIGDEVTAEQVNNWRKRASRPGLHLLPKISEALGLGAEGGGPYDPTFLLRRMGLLPIVTATDAYALAHRVAKLELRFREALEQNAQTGRDFGLAAIMRAARESGLWAVAVWPAIEGPPGCRMHVADRIDLRRIDGEPTSTQEVFDAPAFHRALRDAYAVPSNRTPRWSVQSDQTAMWSISHLGAPMSPIRRVPHPGAASVLCYSTTVGSWVNDVGHLLAFALGYGLTTTRDLAMEVTGITAGATTAATRSQAHQALLVSPPIRRVWVHHAPVDAHVPDPFHVGRTDVPVVWLRESDAVLALRADAGAVGETFKDLVASRDETGRLAEEHPDLIVVDVADVTDVDARWQQVLDMTAAVFARLETEGRLARDAREQWGAIAGMGPNAARPFLTWLADNVPPAPDPTDQARDEGT